MTVEEMTETLSRLGIEVLDTRGDEINGYCYAHKERTGHVDNNPSWWINADSGAFICFSCGWKGNLYKLIGYVTGIDYKDVNDWVGSAASMVARFNRLNKETKPVIEDPVTVTESMLSAFTDVPEEALKSRGLTAFSAKYYGLAWDARNKNWIIPIRDPLSNKLLGWQEKGYDRRYFNNRPAKVKKSGSLFGYEQYGGGDMIVVESPLDVVRLASIGFNGRGVATYGAIISHEQFNLIRGADRIIFALDNDEAGRANSLAMLKLAQDMGVECWFFNYGKIDVKDIGGMSLAEVEEGLQNARHSVKGEKAIV
jgi:DNA primase